LHAVNFDNTKFILDELDIEVISYSTNARVQV